MHIFRGVEKPLPDCFVEKFKWEHPERQSETLERFLLDRKIEVVVNQRCMDSGLIRHLNIACVPHGIKLLSVFHSAPGFEPRYG